MAASVNHGSVLSSGNSGQCFSTSQAGLLMFIASVIPAEYAAGIDTCVLLTACGLTSL